MKTTIPTDTMIADLLAAGWKPYLTQTAWMDPNGRLFRGPALAWHVMNGVPLHTDAKPLTPPNED